MIYIHAGKLSGPGLGQKIANTVRPCATSHLIKEFPGTRSRSSHCCVVKATIRLFSGLMPPGFETRSLVWNGAFAA